MTHCQLDLVFSSDKTLGSHRKGPCDGEIGIVKRTGLAAAKTRQAIVVMRRTFTLAIPRQGEQTQQHENVEEATTARERRDRTLSLRAIHDTRGERFHLYGTYRFIHCLVKTAKLLLSIQH